MSEKNKTAVEQLFLPFNKEKSPLQVLIEL